MPLRFASRASTLVLALLTLAAPARADVITLRDGQRIEGKVVHRDARTGVVQARYGEVVLAADVVASIER